MSPQMFAQRWALRARVNACLTLVDKREDGRASSSGFSGLFDSHQFPGSGVCDRSGGIIEVGYPKRVAIELVGRPEICSWCVDRRVFRCDWSNCELPTAEFIGA